MTQTLRRSAVRIVALLALMSASGPRAALHAQATGFVSGIVLDDATSEPIDGVTVTLAGFEVADSTGEDGRFLVEGVPTGPREIRFRAEGYVTVVQEMELSSADFIQVRLSPVEAVLDEILVLAGKPRRRGSDADQITTDEAEEGWKSVLDLLEDQVPGVVVRRGGGVLGSGAYVYIRGAGSFQQENAPDVYLDGVRLDGRNTDTRSLHILDLISAEEVARIQVLKGASGAAGFALGGANGVILIETHRGPPENDGR